VTGLALGRPIAMMNSMNPGPRGCVAEALDHGHFRIVAPMNHENPGTGADVWFFPDGSATGGRVTLTASKQKRVVDVNWLTGEVRMGDDDSDQ